MARYFKLDKIIKQGTVYTTKKRMGYVIRKIGTNSSGSGYIQIDNKALGYIDSEIAPIHKLTSNLLGPLDLEEFFYVVPPETKLEWKGDSGSKLRIVGDMVFLDPGEGFPAELLTRFAEQKRKYLTTYEGSFSLGTDVAWPDDTEYEILSLTPLTIEKLTLKYVVMLSITGGTVSEGDFGVIFKLNGVSLEEWLAENAPAGIDALSMPYPPKEDTEMLTFTLKDFPIEVLGDNTFSIFVKNVSGADKSPSSGSAWSVEAKLVALYEKAE